MYKKNGGIKRKQHYVPQMYLRHFSVNEKCYAYIPFTKSVELQNIRNLCEQSFLYEIINEQGDYLLGQNTFEDALGQIEDKDGPMLSSIIQKVKDSKEYVRLEGDERESLLGFIVLMLLRNPHTKDILPEVIKTVLGRELSKKEEIKAAWLFTMANIDKIAPEITRCEIVFMETLTSSPFITSSFPMAFSELSIQNHFYMPLSSTVAMELLQPRNSVVDLNTCKKIMLNSKRTDYYNVKLLSREEFIICESKETLEKYVSYMDKVDSSPINPYVMDNMKLIGKMPREYFLKLVVKYVEMEIEEGKNSVYKETYTKLTAQGLSEEKAKNRIAELIEDEFRRAVFNNKRPDYEKCRELLGVI